MSTLQGNAKKYSGAAIDYVLIFNWATGEFIGKAIPDAAGVWTYDYSKNLLCGITYVADGCEPITHGPYYFEHIGTAITSGFLLLSIAGSGGYYYDAWDKNAITSTDWNANFKQVIDVGLLESVFVSGAASLSYQEKTINQFDLNWVLEIFALNSTMPEDDHLLTLELLDSQDVVIAAIKSARDGDNQSGLWYGKSLSSLTKTGQTGSRPYTSGEISFTSNSIVYINKNTSGFNNSFSFFVNLANVTKARVAGSAKSNFLQGGFSGGYMLILPPKPVQ